MKKPDLDFLGKLLDDLEREKSQQGNPLSPQDKNVPLFHRRSRNEEMAILHAFDIANRR